MCSLSRLGAPSGGLHSIQSMYTLTQTVYRLPGKRCSILEESWNFPWRFFPFPDAGTSAGTRVQKVEMDWSGACIGSPHLTLLLCTLSPVMGNSSKRVARFGGYLQPPVSPWSSTTCLFQNLLRKGPVPPWCCRDNMDFRDWAS